MNLQAILFSLPGLVLLLHHQLSASNVAMVVAFQLTPNGKADQPSLSPKTKGAYDLTESGDKTIKKSTPAQFPSERMTKKFQSTSTKLNDDGDLNAALDDLLGKWIAPSQPAIGCIFVGPALRSNFQELVDRAQDRLGPKTQLLTVIGGGVIGDEEELEDSNSLSFLGGILPDGSDVYFFSQTDSDDEDTPLPLKLTDDKLLRPPSHLVFADPHCHKIHPLLSSMEGIIAGGISIATSQESSLALGTTILPPKSLIGATFLGNVGLEVVVTQGSRPVGPTYRVTNVDGAAVHELDSHRAIDMLQETVSRFKGSEDARLMDVSSDDFLGGVHDDSSKYSLDIPPQDFRLRQLTGFRPRSGSILVCGPQIEPGDFFRFHVQSKQIALDDWQATLRQAKTERLFVGEEAGKALGALQISCMGRGQNLFQQPNIDLGHTKRLLPANTPVAGLTANAEIGPVGIRLGTSETSKSVLHGFASVAAIICDFNDCSAEESIPTSCLGNSTAAGAWE